MVPPSAVGLLALGNPAHMRISSSFSPTSSLRAAATVEFSLTTRDVSGGIVQAPSKTLKIDSRTNARKCRV